MSSLNNTAVELRDAWQRLGQRWEDAKSLWTDPVRDDFAAHYWEPLAQQTQSAQRSLERLAQVVAQAQRAVK
jgi:hypothetical protein